MSASHLILEESLFKDYYLNDETKPIKCLPNFNTINIIVGANNSGKTRFMRELMVFKNFTLVNADNFDKYNDLVSNFNRDAKAKSGKHYRPEYAIELLELAKNIKEQYSGNERKVNINRFGFEANYRAKFSQIKNLISTLEIIKSIYIPTLRTAHSLFQIKKEGEAAGRAGSSIPTEYSKISKDIYSNTLVKYYNINNKVDIFTGLHLYKEILNARNSEKKTRDKFAAFESFLSKCFFDGKQVDIVAKFDKDENEQGKNTSELILVHIEDEKETRELYKLGDGIQAIIILVYKIFMAESNSFIYIDEPELNLHPGMQRLFLEQISTNKDLKKKNLTYIITTHSNHFLDLTIEKENVSIYAFSPKETKSGESQFVIRNVNSGDNSVLKHLGVNNSSVFMANCSIWVEGISDRNYIKSFLKLYLKYLEEEKREDNKKEYKSIKEDIDFAFFEYAGSNIEHYVFDEEIAEQEEDLIEKEINSLALSNRIFLLADSDNADKRTKKGKRLLKLEEAKKDNFQPKVIWGVREIENLLTNEVWKKVLINFCEKSLLKTYKDEIQSKIDEVLNKVDYSNYTSKYIGDFLNEIDKKLGKIDGVNILNKVYKINKDGSFGTFIYKRELSELVLNADLDWSVYKENPEIEELTKEIYDFIIGKKPSA